MDSQDSELSFWDHIEDLRKTLLKILSVVAIGTAAALLFSPQIFDAIHSPLTQLNKQISQNGLIPQKVERFRLANSHLDTQLVQLPQDTVHIFISSETIKELPSSQYLIPKGEYLEYEQLSPQAKLILLSPTEGLTATLSTSFWLGIGATSPVWLFFILQFIAPALAVRERKLIYPFIGSSVVVMGMGALFAYLITLPLANHYLTSFNQRLGDNFWSFTQYINYSIVLLLTNALAFESSVILFFLIYYGMISAEWMRTHRRGVIVAIFILSALLTPPDILTQLLLAIPLILIYEVAILYAGFRIKTATKSMI